MYVTFAADNARLKGNTPWQTKEVYYANTVGCVCVTVTAIYDAI